MTSDAISANAPSFAATNTPHMQFEVVAQSPGDFAAWRSAQVMPAAEAATAEESRGRAFVEYRCGLCHQVRGTGAGAVTAPGPDPCDVTPDARRGHACEQFVESTRLDSDAPHCQARFVDAGPESHHATTRRHSCVCGISQMRQPDYRTPLIGIDSVEHQARLLRFWETSSGLKGFLTQRRS